MRRGMRGLVFGLRTIVWISIVGCSLMFLFQLFASFWDYWVVGAINNHFNLASAYELKNVKDPSYYNGIIGSFFVKVLVFNWLLLLAIALLAIWLKSWPFKESELVEDDEQISMPSMAAEPTPNWTTWKLQAKLFFQYQVYPRKFWAWALDGGFSVTDLIVVLLWIGLQVTMIYLTTDYYWQYSVESFEATGIWDYGDKLATQLEAVGLAGAWLCVENLTLLFLPVPRNSFLMYLLNTDFTVLIKYHRWLGHGTLWSLALHGVPFYCQWIHQNKFWSELVAWQKYSINYLAGSLAFLSGIILWITTLPIIRRRFFNIFYYCHIFGFLGFTLFMIIHYNGCVWYVPGLVLYFLDLTYRLSQWGVTSGMQCTYVAADKSFVTLRVTYNKAAKVKPAHFLFLNVPSVSRFAWHPVSVAAVEPGPDGLTDLVSLHVKVYGNWTKAVIRQIHEHGHVKVRADGPYGNPLGRPEWAAFDTVVLIAGGIGITPLMGMLRELTNLQLTTKDTNFLRCKTGWRLPSKVHLIWAVRNREELELLDPEILAAASLPSSWLKLSLFHTGSKDAYKSTPGVPAVAPVHTNPPVPLAAQDVVITDCLRHLQPYSLGNGHWAAAHVLAMVGGFFACLLAQAYISEGYYIGELGFTYWVEGIVMTIALVVGSMGLPAVIIFPLHMFRYQKHVQACEGAHKRYMNKAAIEGRTAINGSSSAESAMMSYMSRFSPVGKADMQAETGGAMDLENGRGVSVSSGRPKLDRMLGDIVREHPGDQSIGVIASGPPPLVNSSRLACQDVSFVAQNLGLRGIHNISFAAHSFEL